MSWPSRIWEERTRKEEWLAQTQICQVLGCSNLAEDSMWCCQSCNDEAYLTDLATSWRGPGADSRRLGVPVMTAHVARNSGAVEWYTPAKYVEAARAVLGSIDLDPASSALANTVVRASTYYTWEEDGLSKHWSGRVWLNPPYSSGPIEKFTRKLADHYRAGDVSAAIVLVNNATETRWFLNVFEPASAACFIRGRIKFWGPAAPSPQGQLWGEDKLSRLTGLQGQCALYLGPDPLHFVEEWKQFGVSGRLVQP